MPEAVHQWLLGRARKRFADERGSREQIRLSLGKGLRDMRREQEALLSLRLRDLVTDEQFVAKRQEMEDRRLDLEGKLAKADQGLGAIQSQLEATFTLAAKAPEIFRSGTKVQRRMILEAVGLNYTLRARKVALDFAKPFSTLAESAGSLNWCTSVDDVWNFLMDRTEYFALPALDLVKSMGQVSHDAKD